MMTNSDSKKILKNIYMSWLVEKYLAENLVFVLKGKDQNV